MDTERLNQTDAELGDGGKAGYRHRQHTLKTSVVPGAIFAFIALIAALIDPWAAISPLALGVVLFVRGALWSRMRTEVTRTHVHATFSPVGPSRTIDRSRIISAERARNPWWSSLGGPVLIRSKAAGLRGWGYEVWGLDAVEVVYTDDGGAKKMIRIGTDDAAGFEAAINA